MLQCTDTFNPEYRVSWNKANLHVSMHRPLQSWVQGVLKQGKPSCFNTQTPSTPNTGCPETRQTFKLQCTDTEYRVFWNKADLHVTMHRHLQPLAQGFLKQAKPSCYNAQTPSILSTGCPEARQTFMFQCTDPFNSQYRVSWNKPNLHITMHRHLQPWVEGVLKQAKPSCYNVKKPSTLSTGCLETRQTFMFQCTDPFNSQYRVSWNKPNLHITMHRPLQPRVEGVLKQAKPSCYNVKKPSTLSTGCPETSQTFMLQCTDTFNPE